VIKLIEEDFDDEMITSQIRLDDLIDNINSSIKDILSNLHILKDEYDVENIDEINKHAINFANYVGAHLWK